MSDKKGSSPYRELKAGEVIFRRGDEGREMFLIDRGEVEVVLEADERGEESVVATLGTRDFFGEMALLEGEPRTATVRARTDCRVLPVDGEMFNRLLQHDPSIALRIMRKLCARLRAFENRLIDLGADPEASEAPADAELSRSRSFPIPVALPAARLVERASGAVFPLSGPSLSVGRIDRAAGTLPEIDLSEVDTERTTSRRHARVVYRDGSFAVREEVGSTNGTFVAGRRLSAGEEVALEDGDEVAFGSVQMRFELDFKKTRAG
ncbi:MAG: FHA domain-containing protein [Acidobacteria bacterium]|nr:MAG: FHA domain-containing protein [Acidobacteriota bacterium]REK03206.1 MAG: FHA domain-containing protein [Acidobacteriota bacterium]